MLTQKLCAALALLLSASLARAADDAATAPVTVRRQEHMTTYVTITVATPETPAVLAAIDAGFAEVRRLETILSEWRPGSDVSQLNAGAGKAPVKVSPDVLANLEMGKQLGRETDGRFDITVGALWGAWDFRWQQPKVPSRDELSRLLPLIDYRRIQIDRCAGTAFLPEPGMRVVLGGIGKGYIVDRVSDLLKGRGYRDHLIVAGGEVLGAGTKHGKKWRIGVRDPRTSEAYGTIDIEDEALSTSGNYERFFIKDGVRYHHILDPKTGHPVHGLAADTVLARTSTLADAYDTPVFILGKEKGLALAKAKGFEVLMFDESDFAETATPGFKARLVRTNGGSADVPLAGRPAAPGPAQGRAEPARP